MRSMTFAAVAALLAAPALALQAAPDTQPTDVPEPKTETSSEAPAPTDADTQGADKQD